MLEHPHDEDEGGLVDEGVETAGKGDEPGPVRHRDYVVAFACRQLTDPGGCLDDQDGQEKQKTPKGHTSPILDPLQSVAEDQSQREGHDQHAGDQSDRHLVQIPGDELGEGVPDELAGVAEVVEGNGEPVEGEEDGGGQTGPGAEDVVHQFAVAVGFGVQAVGFEDEKGRVGVDRQRQDQGHQCADK